jgi:hypothetical protein
MENQLEIDYSKFNAFSRDGLRVDCGLMIQRRPIFVHITDSDRKHQLYTEQIKQDWGIDPRAFVGEKEEVAQFNEDILHDNPYKSMMNLDNFPTHKNEKGEKYFAASKYFKLVDPKVDDPKSLHYASQYNTYLLVKNKYTQEWEFPTTEMFIGETFLRAKQNLFQGITPQDQWKIKYF